MIVKKIAIFQGFSDIHTLKEMTLRLLKIYLEMLLRISIFHHYFMILKPLDWDEIHLFYI